MKGNMRIDKRFYEQIDRALAGVNLPVTVYTAGGEQVYPASPREIREEEIPSLPWEEDMAVFGSMRFLQLPNLKGMVVGLPLYLAGGQEILQLAGALLSTLARSIDRDMDRDEVLRRVLLDGLDGTELETLALEHGLEMDRQRCAVLFQSEGDAKDVASTLREVFSSSVNDLIVRIGRNSTVLLRAMESTQYDELNELVMAVMETVGEETGAKLLAGIGEIQMSLGSMNRSLHEARRALEIGRAFRPGGKVYSYRSLLIERFMCEIPPETARRYYEMLFNKKNARVFNEEMVQTIDKFFDCHLNVSEAARQLYIHRNTLVYRLDKVQKATGLDLRAFDDAITFKMLRMLGHVGEGQKPAL